MQSTADFPSDITNALLPQADPVFDDATTLDTAVDMLDPQSTIVEHLVGFALAHAEQPSLDHLNGVGLQVRTPARINAPVCPRDSLGMSWILINRPIVVAPLGVKLCRPSETVLCLLPSPR